MQFRRDMVRRAFVCFLALGMFTGAMWYAGMIKADQSHKQYIARSH